MIKINGVDASNLNKDEIIKHLETAVKQRDSYQLANSALNGFIGQQEAEIQLLRTELRIIKEEIAAIDNFRKNGCAN